MMTKLDGFELAKAIRNTNTNIPILFLSAKTLKEDRIKGLKIGADDYLVKPFSIEELLLKIEIFLKRSQKNSINTIKYSIGSFEFDAENYLLLKEEKRISLTQREAQLLQFFLENKNKILKRETILQSLWGNDDYFSGRSLDVFISRLRKILASEPKVSIENQHGVGFRFVLD
jgi:DNA-binding response OmpR family regulator